MTGVWFRLVLGRVEIRGFSPTVTNSGTSTPAASPKLPASALPRVSGGRRSRRRAAVNGKHSLHEGLQLRRWFASPGHPPGHGCPEARFLTSRASSPHSGGLH